MDAFVRYYDPVAARFLSEDPVLTDANTGKSFNRYVYAENNPYKYIDPDGRLPILLLAPVVLKGIDLAITAVELYSAAQTGGASAVAMVAAESAVTNFVPGGKVAKQIAKAVDKASDGAQVASRGSKFKGEVWAGNTAKNNGSPKCETCGIDVKPGGKVERGDKIPSDRGEADHKQRLKSGGADDAKTNGQLLCHDCHKEKTRMENSKQND